MVSSPSLFSYGVICWERDINYVVYRCRNGMWWHQKNFHHRMTLSRAYVEILCLAHFISPLHRFFRAHNVFANDICQCRSISYADIFREWCFIELNNLNCLPGVICNLFRSFGNYIEYWKIVAHQYRSILIQKDQPWSISALLVQYWPDILVLVENNNREKKNYLHFSRTS